MPETLYEIRGLTKAYVRGKQVVEVLHGIARTVVLAPVVGDLRARQIAMFTIVTVIASAHMPSLAGSRVAMSITVASAEGPSEAAIARKPSTCSWSNSSSTWTSIA